MPTQASPARQICEAQWLGIVQYSDGLRLQERAVELDPTNEMAVKGLQAMGVHPTAKLDETVVPSAPAAAAAFAAAEPERPMTDEERYAAELDSAFDDYDSVPRSETPRRNVDDTAEMLSGAVAADRATSSGRSAHHWRPMEAQQAAGRRR